VSIPIIVIHSCTETATNVEYLDVTFGDMGLEKIPSVVAIIDENINVFVSSVTKTSARINFSQAYTGKVRYTVMSNEL
jgi:hypothetical protein